MNSMLRQNQIRLQDIKPYVRLFNRNDPRNPKEWAKEESSMFEPGALVFLLEPAKRPPGMSSFARTPQFDQGVAQDSFRVKDLCVVVDIVEGKPWVLTIGPSAYELRFLDALFFERGQKSILDGVDFNYLIARSRQPLTQDKLKELRELSAVYSRGSRRMAQDGSGPEEPAKAVLIFFGADVGSVAGKQVLELGSVCNMIFAPDCLQENKLQSLIKSCFTPILATDKLGSNEQASKSPAVDLAVSPSTTSVSAGAPASSLGLEDSSALYRPLDEMPKQVSTAAVTSEFLGEAENAGDSQATFKAESNWITAPPSDFQQDLSKLSDDFTAIDEQFRALDEQPELISSFKSLEQPPIEMSPDMPPILTGDHPIITVAQQLSPENGQPSLPSLPAWYMTTHDLDEMNSVALRLQQTAAQLPEGLDRLEAELSYDSLPAVEFKAEEPAPGTTGGATPEMAPAAPGVLSPDVSDTVSPEPAKEDFSAQFKADYDHGLAGQAAFKTGGPKGAEAEPGEEISALAEEPEEVAQSLEQEQPAYEELIFEGTGARGSLETNPEAIPTRGAPTPHSTDWQPKSRPGRRRGSTSSSNLPPSSEWAALPSPEEVQEAEPSVSQEEEPNLFDRLKAPDASAQTSAESACEPSSSEPAVRGRPTNLKDMLTADSAVFSMQDIGMPPDMPGTTSTPAASPAQEEKAKALKAAQFPWSAPAPSKSSEPAVAEEQAPCPWTSLPKAPSFEASAALEPAEKASPWEGPAASSSALAARKEPAAVESTEQQLEQAPPAENASAQNQEDYKQLAEALHGLIDSQSATEPAPAENARAESASPQRTARARSLFDDDTIEENAEPVAQELPESLNIGGVSTPPAEAPSKNFWEESRSKESMQMTQDLSEVIPEELKLRLTSLATGEPQESEPKAAAATSEFYIPPPPEVAPAETPPLAETPEQVQGEEPGATEARRYGAPLPAAGSLKRSFRPLRPPSEAVCEIAEAMGGSAQAEEAQNEAAAEPSAEVAPSEEPRQVRRASTDWARPTLEPEAPAEEPIQRAAIESPAAETYEAAPATSVWPEPQAETIEQVEQSVSQPPSTYWPEPIARVEPPPAVVPEPQPVAQVELAPLVVSEPQPVAQVEPPPAVVPEPQPVAQVEPAPVVVPEAQPVTQVEPAPAVIPDVQPLGRVEPAAVVVRGVQPAAQIKAPPPVVLEAPVAPVESPPYVVPEEQAVAQLEPPPAVVPESRPVPAAAVVPKPVVIPEVQASAQIEPAPIQPAPAYMTEEPAKEVEPSKGFSAPTVDLPKSTHERLFPQFGQPEKDLTGQAPYSQRPETPAVPTYETEKATPPFAQTVPPAAQTHSEQPQLAPENAEAPLSSPAQVEPTHPQPAPAVRETPQAVTPPQPSRIEAPLPHVPGAESETGAHLALAASRGQPVEPKLVISESARFMARLNQRLLEADKKLSSRCEQSRDRLVRELEALVEEAQKAERQNELAIGSRTSQLITHLENVSDEIKTRIASGAHENRAELQQLTNAAERALSQLHQTMNEELVTTSKSFQGQLDSMLDRTKLNLGQHAQKRVNQLLQKVEEIISSLESVYDHHEGALLTRFERFKTRLNQEIDAIVSSLDRNVKSMTAEIDGSWDRASEKLTVSKVDFANSVDHLVHVSGAEIKQEHLDAYANQVLPRLLENKDILRAMLADMKRNFEEQSERLMKDQVSSIASNISFVRDELNKLTRECLSDMESVGKEQQNGLEDLFKSTSNRLEEIMDTVESKVKSAKQAALDNDEASTRISEASRVEDEPAFSKEKQQAVAALNEYRTKSDNALESSITSYCVKLEHLSEQLQEELAKQRTDWASSVRVTTDDSINKIKQAIQDALQSIETAKDQIME